MTPMNIVALAALAIVAALYIRKLVQRRGITQYDADRLRGKLKEKEAVTLLDVRTAGERSRGHIRGSLHIPLHELARRSGELERFRTTEIICYCQSGSRSLSAAHALQRMGYRAANLAGGMSSWRLSE